MELMQHALNWFEIPVEDFERAKQFYSRVLDYEMAEHQWGPNRMGLLRFGKNSVGGAIVKGPGYVPTRSGVFVYLNGGDDLNVVLDRVVAAGGQVVREKTLFAPEVGYFALFLDTEGNELGLHSMA
jgi:predicted enzyme related to lactoylglutathione lyase